MNTEFTMENTSGYTQEQLNDFNNEWNEIIEERGLNLYGETHDEYLDALQDFSDGIARR